MKHVARSLMVVGAIMTAGSAGADMFSDFNPYVGADYYHAWMKGRSSWSQIFPKTYRGATLYIGNKFTENLGLELGYDWSTRAKKNWSLAQGTSFFNGTVTANPQTGTTKIRRFGVHLDLVGFLPINDCVNLLASIGYGWMRTKVEIENLIPSTTNHASALSSVSGKGRSVLRLGVGADWMVTDIVGLRAKAGWESTSALKVTGNATFAALGYQTKAFKSSVTGAIGAFIKF